MAAAALSVMFIASAVLPFHYVLAASPEKPIVELANPKGKGRETHDTYYIHIFICDEAVSSIDHI